MDPKRRYPNFRKVPFCSCSISGVEVWNIKGRDSLTGCLSILGLPSENSDFGGLLKQLGVPCLGVLNMRMLLKLWVNHTFQHPLFTEYT